jgi:RNA polymerase sigma-70 factor (ECF subfamily)
LRYTQPGASWFNDEGSTMNRRRSRSVVPDVASTTDELLLRELYARHGPPLYRFALRLLGGDRQRAEDVVQETLLRAWRHPQAVADEAGDPRPWLFTVARHLVVDGIRAQRARPDEVAMDRLDTLPADDTLEATLESWVVADAVATLSPAHRQVLTETYYRGRSVAEAASALHVPPGTVKSRTYYALRALRLALEERGLTR